MRKPLHQLHESDFEASDSGQRWLDLVRGYVLDIRQLDLPWNPPAMSANDHIEETVTATGLKVGDIILTVIKPTFTAGFHVGQGRVDADDTISIEITNGKGSGSNPGLETYTVIYIKNTKA